VQALVDAGVLTAEEARHHPESNVLVQALGGGAGAQASMALSSNRKLLDVDREFEQWQRRLLRRESEL